MPAILANEEILIEKSVGEVYEYVRNFEQWPEWSPWLVCETDTKLNFQTDAYSWEGKFVGSGKMIIKDETANEQIVYDLEFLKPWKSHADINIKFASEGEGTRVTWSMDSSLPFFMFFMKSMMECMIAMDYQRGLRMLKEKLETGRVSSQLEMEDRVAVPECRYVGIERMCSMDEMPNTMAKDFEKLAPLYAEQGDHSEPMFTIYNKWQLSKGQVSYIACCPVKTTPATAPTGMHSGTRPACDAYAVIHTGSYTHLGNAWSAGMMRSRAKLFKQSKKVFPFEQYLTNPAETPDDETVTRVCMPRKD